MLQKDFLCTQQHPPLRYKDQAEKNKHTKNRLEQDSYLRVSAFSCNNVKEIEKMRCFLLKTFYFYFSLTFMFREFLIGSAMLFSLLDK